MKLLSWYCVIISTFLLISFMVSPTQASNLPWYVVPIMRITIIFYAFFLWLAALNRNIPVVLVYIARAINVFYGLIALVGLIIFVRNFELFDIALFIIILPLLIYCEKKVRTILKLKNLSPQKESVMMKSQVKNIDDSIVTQYWERGEGTGSISKILSGLTFLILTILAVQMIKDQQYMPLVLIAILMWTRFGIFVMVAGFIYFLTSKYWPGVGILSVYLVVSILSTELGKRNIKRLLLSGIPMISPFEGMLEMRWILVFECLSLAVALSTNGWISVVFWCLFGLIVLYHILRYWLRLNPRWSQVHHPLMVRYAGFAGLETGQAEREERKIDFFSATTSLIKSVYPDKKEEEIGAISDNAAKKMDLFSDRDLIKKTIQKRNSSVSNDTIQNLLDKFERHLQTDERRFMIVRYTIAEIVETVFGQEERGAYLLAVIEGKAN